MRLHQTTRSRVLSALGWTAATRILAQAFTWAVTLVVVRLLTPSDYGLVAMATVFIGFLTLMNELGMGAALIQTREPIGDALLRRVTGLVVLVNAALFGILSAAAPLIAGFFDEPRLVLIVRVLALQFLLASLAIVPQSLLERRLDFKRRSLVELAATVAGAVVTLLLALRGAGVWALISGSLSTSAARAIGLNLAEPSLRLPSFDFRGLSGILSFGGLITVDRVLWFLYSQSDVFIVGRVLGKEALGLYSIALQIASVPLDKLATIVTRVAFPAFSSVQGEPERLAGYLRKSIRILGLVTFPVSFGIAAIGPELVFVAVGRDWAGAALPLVLLSLVMPLRGMSGVLSTAVRGVGRAALGVMNLALALVVMPVAFLVGSRYGIVGVSIGWLVGYLLVFLVTLSRSAPAVGISRRALLGSLARPALASAAMFTAVAGAKGRLVATPAEATPIDLAILVLLGIGAYCGVLLVIGRETVREAIDLARSSRSA
jgi:O-antigen/teichoic acid export membrane protein